MGRQSGFQQAFNVGEIGPDAWWRSDLAQHSKGCAVGFNLIGRVAGPAGRRPGTWFRGLPKHADRKARLIPFRRSSGDALLLEFGDAYVRVWTVNGAPVMDGGSPVEFASPYATAQVDGIRYRQQGDVLYLTHADGLRPQTLIRVSNLLWQIAPTVFVDGPWRAENIDQGKTLTLDGTSLTADGHAPFTPQHVGGLWRLRQNSGNPGVTSWEPDEQDVPDNDRRLSNGRVYARTGGVNDTGNTPPVHDSGTVSDGKALWDFIHDGAGVVRVAAYLSATQVDVELLTGMPDGLEDGTFNWAEGAYSDHRGWPTAPPAVREERLVLAGSASEPDVIDFTRTAGFSPARLDFKPGLGTGRVVDDDSVRRFVGEERDRIVWLAGSTFLMAGTTAGEHLITGGTVDDPISPSGCVARPLGQYGSADVMPELAHGGVLHVAAGGETLRLVRMAPDQSMEQRDLTVVAEHIGGRGIAELTWLKQPHNLLWVRLADGGQATFTWHPEQGVEGWNRQGLAARDLPTADQPLGGGLTLESSCVVPGLNGRPRLFMIVSRLKDDVTQRMILQLADPKDGLFLDAAEAYAGAAASGVSGLDHLAGEAITVMARTAPGTETPAIGWGEYRDRPVSIGGAVSLPESDGIAATADRMYAGLPYLSRWEGLPPDLLGPGSSAGRLVSYTHVHLTLLAAVCEVGTTSDEEGDSGTDRLLERLPSDIAGPALRRKSWRSVLQGGASRDRRYFVQTDSGWDMVIYNIRPTAGVDG